MIKSEEKEKKNKKIEKPRRNNWNKKATTGLITASPKWALPKAGE